MEKKYQIKDSVTNEIFEETHSEEAAIKLLGIIQKDNPKAIIFTPSIEEKEDEGFTINSEDLSNPETPEEDYGNDLDEFNDPSDGSISPEEFKKLF